MERILRNVLTASFHGSIVILAVLALRLLLRRAPKKYACMLWLLVGIRLLLPFQLESGLSLQPQTSQLTQISQQAIHIGVLIPGMEIPQLSPPAEEPSAPAFSQARPEPEPESAPALAEAEPEKPAVSWREFILWVYLAVVASFGVYCVQGYLRLRRRVRFAVKIPGGWECEGLETAFILGFIRPKIYIPMGMSRANRRYILAHERTHLEKGDHWVKLIAFIALAIHWFNPLVWLSYILLCRDMEMACDERVVRFMELEERKAYSHALLTCSSGRNHYAACPMAFGEVNVKNRILSVLNYRKPSFWVSLVSVIAIILVAVTLVTSPREAQETGDPTPEAGGNASVPQETGYCSQMKESEIAYICQQALEDLRYGESYYITLDVVTVSTSRAYGDYTQTTHFRRHGSDYLAQGMEDGVMATGFMSYQGRHGYSMGQPFIIWGQEQWGSDSWMDTYSPQGKMISFPEGAGVIAGDRVSYFAQWEEVVLGTRSWQGTFTYIFGEDGSLQSILAETSFPVEDGTVTETSVLTCREESPEETRLYMENVAAAGMTQAEYEAWLLDQETITEVPSNKTSYDRELLLGSGSMQWKYFGETGHVRIGAEEVSAIGATLVYSEADDVHSAFTAEEGFWLEYYRDGQWVMAEELQAPQRSVSVGWSTTDRCTLTWPELQEGGFYRIGRYHTMVLNGERETRVCYAKFRLYTGEEKALMETAWNAWNGLFNSGSYEIYHVDHNNIHNESDHYSITQIWKHSRDYLMLSRMPYHDGSGYWGKSGCMWRDGVQYALEWAGDTVSSPIAQWQTVTYLDETNFTLWNAGYQWYDAQVEGIWQEGNTIVIQSVYDFDDRFEAEQVLLRMDSQGNLMGLAKRYLPTRDCPEADMVIAQEMTVKSTSAEEIQKIIAGQDLTQVPQFSWEEDKALYPAGSDNVRSRNFVNSQAVTMSGTQSVIQRALQDCTLPAFSGMEPGTNVFKAYFDPTQRIWKVEFTASWDSTVYQAVYLTEQGITILTVTLELAPKG